MAFETNETKEQVQTDEYTEVERDLLQHREDLEQKYIDYSDKLLQDRKELTRRYRKHADQLLKHDPQGSQLLSQKQKLVAQISRRADELMQVDKSGAVLFEKMQSIDKKIANLPNLHQGLVSFQTAETGNLIALTNSLTHKPHRPRPETVEPTNTTAPPTSQLQPPVNEDDNPSTNRPNSSESTIPKEHATSTLDEVGNSSPVHVPSKAHPEAFELPGDTPVNSTVTETALLEPEKEQTPALSAKTTNLTENKVTKEQFKEIQRVYTCSCLHEGIAYLLYCAICGANAPDTSANSL